MKIAARIGIALGMLLLTFCLLIPSWTPVLAATGISGPDGVRERTIAYAVVVKQSTYDDPDWRLVVDALLAKYPSRLFTWTSSLNEIDSEVSDWRPTHVGFVCDMATASASFIEYYVWSFIRGLDTDNYCDAIWGIITGCDAEDAMGLVTCPSSVEMKTVLGGTLSCDLAYYTQGIATSEGTYHLYYIKHSDSEATIQYNDGPTDRTEWLVTMINEGIDIFDYDPVDIFYSSGHGAHNMWQMHYPTSGLEGYFRSSNGQAYGDPHSGDNININSANPKIYFGLGNCQIGKILSSYSMAPAWINTGGAVHYTGYVINEGGSSFQHGGTKAYFYKASRDNTWAEAYYLSNQALRFDILNNTPGVNPIDLNGSAFYGDPALQVKMSLEGLYREPLFSTELTVHSGAVRDTANYKITMNREGSPGVTSKWGERHPAIILPFWAEDVEIVSTDAISVVVENDFALMYIWYQGQAALAEGATREVVFTYTTTTTGVDDSDQDVGSPERIQCRNHPNPFNPSTKISYTLPTAGRVTLRIFDIEGCLVDYLVDADRDAGTHVAHWDAGDAPSGVYFYCVSANGMSETGKCVLLK